MGAPNTSSPPGSNPGPGGDAPVQPPVPAPVGFPNDYPAFPVAGSLPATSALLYRGAPVTLRQAVAEGRPVIAARWGIPDILITLALWFFFQIVASLIALGLGDSPVGKSVGILLLISIPWFGLAGWPILVAFWRGNGPVIDYGLTRRWSDLWWGILYGVAALVVAGLVAAGTEAIFGKFDSAAGEIAGDVKQLWALVLFGILVGIGAPIAEELAFRGLLFGSLAKRGLAPWLTIGITALTFSLIHFEPIRIPLLLSTGIILGLARFHRGSTTTSIVAHMTNNLPAAVVLILGS